MAATNLYPPIISTTMPTFLKTSTCKVYFSISNYNSLSDIANAQVVVNNQSTNNSVLESTSYPSGIKITSIYEDDSVEDDAKYYIEISASDLTLGEFEVNQYYKVQIRFTSTAAAAVSGSTGIASWLTNNQDYFSEWSTVCLIRGIDTPSFTFTGFTSGSTSTLTSEIIQFVGTMSFEDATEKEYLSSYNISIYNGSTLITESGIQYTDDYNPNEINYTLTYLLSTNITYTAIIEYTTKGGYSDSISYNFVIEINTEGDVDAEFNITTDVENGRNIIEITGTFNGNIILKRASNETNFTIWETIDNTEATSSSYIFYDYTIKSGVYYQYAIQLLQNNVYSNVLTSDQVINILDDAFLTRADMQLRIRYNPSVTSFKRTQVESLTQTIGSQYPYIRRNGAVDYKQFSIGGLITGFCDEEGVFLSRETIYGDYVTNYASYNEENKVDSSYDFIYEREFREKIIDFLYDDTVKLFRSTPEGNIMVRLMDISLSPEEVLGRMLYSFIATAYEIDSCSIENYQTYGIM